MVQLDLQITLRIFEKNWNSAEEHQGNMINEDTWIQKFRGTIPLNNKQDFLVLFLCSSFLFVLQLGRMLHSLQVGVKENAFQWENQLLPLKRFTVYPRRRGRYGRIYKIKFYIELDHQTCAQSHSQDETTYHLAIRFLSNLSAIVVAALPDLPVPSCSCAQL
jgi:hypothetical protein